MQLEANMFFYLAQSTKDEATQSVGHTVPTQLLLPMHFMAG